MSITSFQFLAFVLITFIVYNVFPQKHKWVVLLAASAVFYISFSPWGILFLIATALIAFFSAKQIQKVKDAESAWMSENKRKVDKETRKAKKDAFKKQRNLWVVLTVAVSIGTLFMCKYYGALAGSVNHVWGTTFWTAENIILPLGISYYSLQLIGYVIDVSRDIIPAEKNPLKVVLYGMFFLSIMQGPFNRYNDLMPQICAEERNKLTYLDFKFAVLRIVGGYIKKLCIADQVGIIANEVFTNYENYAGLGIFVGIVCFAVQLYADFSGYMDIIVGIGQLFGIKMPENFRQPFFSRNMSEFWKRWHITLGMWLQDYVFYPILKSSIFKKMGKGITDKLGKEAGRRIPTYIGMFILWTLIGAWHGAGFNYVFGVGILQFLYIFTGELCEPVFKKAKGFLHINDKSLGWHIFQSLRCTALMMFAWVFFNSRTFSDALGMLRKLFVIPNLSQLTIGLFESGEGAVSGYILNWMVFLLVCISSLIIADLLHEKNISVRSSVLDRPFPVRALCYIFLFFILLIFAAYGDQNAASNFIYFEF